MKLVWENGFFLPFLVESIYSIIKFAVPVPVQDTVLYCTHTATTTVKQEIEQLHAQTAFLCKGVRYLSKTSCHNHIQSIYF